MDVFVEFSLVLVVATLVSMLMKVLRQPLVVGYIASGIILGPYFLGVTHSVEYIEVFSKIGIAILLFIVGISLNPLTVREVGKMSLISGFAQVFFTAVVGFLFSFFLGFNILTSLLVSIALTFSSTIIILKLLSDKGDLAKLYGKISVGILLVQDLVAMVVLLFISIGGNSLGNIEGVSIGALLYVLLLKSILLASFLYLFNKYLLPSISKFLATSQELLFLFSMAWGLGLASLFSVLGFSIEIGALIAGVSLSVSPFAYEITSRMRPLRDFFVVLFFVLLGVQIELGDVFKLLPSALVISFGVLLLKPIIVFVIMNILGYRRKTSFQTSITMAQISEFSLILLTIAFGLGYLTKDVLTVITLVGIITISLSTYLMIYSISIYNRIEWFFKFLEFKKHHRKESDGSEGLVDTMIFGYGRIGVDFVHAAEKIGKDFLVVDFNPQVIKKLQQKNIAFKYGDADDTEFLHEINFYKAKLVASTITDFDTNVLLVKEYRKVNHEGIIIVLSHDVKETRALYLHGASYVVMPHFLGAHHASRMIEKYGFDSESFTRERNIQLAKLEKHEE